MKRDINIDDEDYLTATRVMESLTDPDDYQKKDENDLVDFGATSVMERYTDPDREPQQKEEIKKDYDDEDEDDGDDQKKSARKEVWSFMKDLVICMAVALVITNFVARPVQVSGRSMYPTLEDASLGFSNVLGYTFGSIDRFDIVIIYLPDRGEYLVKRVVGLPGETIRYTDGQLYVNDEAVEENFLDASYMNSYGENFMTDISSVTLGDDEYYCLGDNRPHSTDSRYYGPFKKENIKSKGIFIFYPFNQFGVETW